MKKQARITKTAAAVGFCLVMLVSGCGGKEPTPTEYVPTDSPTESVSTTVGTGFEEAELPQDFPANFPIPEDARVGSAVNAGEGAFRVYLGLQGTMEEVLAYYRKELPVAGWTITADIESQGQPKLEISRAEYQGELQFIGAESGVGLEVYLYPPQNALDQPDIPDDIGESTTLGSQEGDFPSDLPLPASFNPVGLSERLTGQGYQLAFSYQGLPELALADLTMALINGGWSIGDPALESNLKAYQVPFENPATGFQGIVLISNDPAAVGAESQGSTIIAFRSGK